ncbi:MAG: cation:proton antiporter [Longimicrobiales bacterium]
MLLVQIAVLLFAARGLGELASRLGQPAVVGEILAGILLGPSVLGAAAPWLSEWVIPTPGVPGYLLETVSLIGAMLLLLITGLEMDLGLIRHHARTAIGVSYGGILVTFTSGFLLGHVIPDALLVDPDDRLIFALFMATAMSISAIPVIAKVLMDMNLMRRDIGQTIIAAGMSDDTTGWILLSIVAGLATSGAITSSTVLRAIGAVLGFLLFSFTVGRWVFARALEFVQDEVRAPYRLVSLVLVATFAWGAMTQALGLEAVLGAFVAGILFSQLPRLPESVHNALTTIALGVFTPIFFAVAGLKVDARALFEPGLLLITLLVIAVASVGKVAGTYAGARLIGRRDHWTALTFGAGLNARGAMEIIIATIGLSLGILSQPMFSIIVVMAMATSLMAPPALRWTLSRVRPEQEELARLEKEKRAAKSPVARLRRVLIPLRPRGEPGPVRRIKSLLIGRLSERQPLSVTLLSIAEPETLEVANAAIELAKSQIPAARISGKIVEGGQPIDVILAEAAKDYDLLVLGATEQRPRSPNIFHPVVDELVRLTPCMSWVVRSGPISANWEPRRMLVPTNGSAAARVAAELAFLVARPPEEVLVLTVVRRPETMLATYVRADRRQQEIEMGRSIVDELRRLGEAYGARVRTVVREGTDPEDQILRIAREERVDLVLLGTDVRPASDRLYLGPRVTTILDDAPCPVVVVNSAL